MPPRLALACILLLIALPATAQQRVSVASFEPGAYGAPVALVGHWFATASAPAPAAVLLHGCGGAYDRRGNLSARLREYAGLLNGMGLHVLVLDSFSPRGVREICTQQPGSRRVTLAQRRLDALAALRWLAEHGDVDAARIGLVGWSNGGSTVLAASNLTHRDVAQAKVRPAFAVAFYPGCAYESKLGYRPAAPLLLMVGEADDWTPAEPCRKLAEQASAPAPEFHAYAGAHHGFDGDGPVRLRRDVPGGARPGEGVHVGGDADARRRSREALQRFLTERTGSRTGPRN